MTELKSYLGLLTYYGKFLSNLSTRLAPLYKLLSKKEPWKWTSAQDKAFNESKELLTSSQLLVHFDSKFPLLLACNASAYGIGAVLAHRMPDGSEKLIGYASRTLNSAERNYSQLEKEGLSLVFGIKQFYSYLFRVCLSYPEFRRAKLLPAREGGPFISLWNQAILLVLVWSFIHSNHRPQAAAWPP